MSFLEAFSKLVPWWLSEGDGGKVLASLSLMSDDFKARAKNALLARFPDYAPDDAALAALGRDRRIVRGINEPAAAYAARLKRALDDLRRRGSPFALLEQLQAYLQAPCVVHTVDVSGNWFSIDAAGVETSNLMLGDWVWDALPAAQWSRFFVVIHPVALVTPWHITGLFGAAGAVAESDTLGTTATPDQVAQMRQIVRDWKPAHAKCEWIIVSYDAAEFGPGTGTVTSGLFGDWSKVVSGVRVASRFADARYISGAE